MSAREAGAQDRSTGTGPERTERAETRRRRLADRVRGLRRRAVGSGDRWLLVLGGAFATLGVFVVFLGWLGSAETHVVFEQIPYLISGGLLGLGLIFLGGFLYFAYWLTLVVRENRELRRQLLADRQELDGLHARLIEALEARSPSAPARRASKRTASRGRSR